MEIAFEPLENKENKYIELMQMCLKELGYDIVALKKMGNKDCKVLILNWYEDSPYPINSYKNILMLIKRILRIVYAHAIGKKVVYVMHNRQSHDKRMVSRLLQKFLVNNADIIQIHSKATEKYVEEKNKNKLFYIPHPNYIGCYPSRTNLYTRQGLGLRDDRPILLFVGAIKPYKNIELLINVAKQYPTIQFLIAGKPSNNQYKDKLLDSVNGIENINMVFKFIPDDELTSLLKISDAIVLPYDISSSLNSGTVYLAFSNKKTVIAPLIATLEDISEYEFFFGYNYSTQDEHEEKLEEVLRKLISEYDNDKHLLNQMGEEAYQYVKKRHSKEKIMNSYTEMFTKLGI